MLAAQGEEGGGTNMASEVTTSTPVASAGSPKAANGVLLPVVFFLLALAVVGAAFYFVGGVDYVTSLLGIGQAPDSGGATPAAVPAASTPTVVSTTKLELPPGVSPELAKRMYVEQIQSQDDFNKMTAGQVALFEVTSVKSGADAASAFVTARFTDGSSAPGVIKLVKRGGAWYFVSITGLNENGGTAVNSQKGDAEVVSESGIKDFDYAVINTIVAQQEANQTIIVGLVDGSFSTITFGKPVSGAGTTVVPSSFAGTDAKTIAGEAVMIHTTDGKAKYTFLTSFRTN
jgi:hypothetical protein